MKLERIKINGIEYYQFVKIATEEPFINEVGDIFSDSNDIDRQRAKMIEIHKPKQKYKWTIAYKKPILRREAIDLVSRIKNKPNIKKTGILDVKIEKIANKELYNVLIKEKND